MITTDLLAEIIQCPPERAVRWHPALMQSMQHFGINTPRRAAHFLAQVGHESVGLACLEENLSYTIQRLRSVFPHRIPDHLYSAFANHPQSLANWIYANRKGNGPVSSGDGYRYRGRGPLQLTGRDNYRLIGERIARPLETQPDLVRSIQTGALAAAAYFTDSRLLRLADSNDTLGVSRWINLGTTNTTTCPNGFADRVARTERALAQLRYARAIFP